MPGRNPLGKGRDPKTPPPGSRRAGAGNALAAWLVAFVVVQIASAIVLVSTGYLEDVDNLPMSVNTLLAVVMWAFQLVAVAWWAGSSVGTDLVRATGLAVRPRDAWWLLVGAACQFILMPIVNWPLQRLFPEQFSVEKVSERAETLADSAAGLWVVALVLVVVAGAPLVEEIVYRGMIQTGFVASWGPVAGVVVTSAMFAGIHLSWPEFPALFAFALVLGVGRHRAGRLGPAIMAHVGFNACGLLAVAAL
ncbi:MAG: lysostaphin resistance A-like protein [Actinomycetota bacterium]